jgi:hypothetical protein
MVRDADLLQPVVLGVLQDPLCGLCRVTGTGGQKRMDVIVVIDPESHKNRSFNNDGSTLEKAGQGDPVRLKFYSAKR